MFNNLEIAYQRYLAGYEYVKKLQNEHSSEYEHLQYLSEIEVLDIKGFEFRLTHHEEFAEVFGKDCTELLTLKERINIWFHRDKPNRDVVDYFDDKLNEKQKLDFLKDREVPFRKIVYTKRHDIFI